MKDFFVRLIVVFLIAASLGCDSEVQYSSNAKIVENATVKPQELGTGIYLINRWTVEEGVLDPLFPNELYVEYQEDKFRELAEEEPEPTKYIALDGNEHVPLDLEKKPERLDGADGRAEVALSFTAKMQQKLKEFSRVYLGRQIALVIDGEIVTIHKIRSVLTGNGLKISRCTDDGCELILARLKD